MLIPFLLAFRSNWFQTQHPSVVIIKGLEIQTTVYKEPITCKWCWYFLLAYVDNNWFQTQPPSTVNIKGLELQTKSRAKWCWIDDTFPTSSQIKLPADSSSFDSKYERVDKRSDIHVQREWIEHSPGISHRVIIWFVAHKWLPTPTDM